jgi:hypothetical protein
VNLIGWSDFAAKRHQVGTGHSYFKYHLDEVAALVEDNFHKALPGQGETDLARKVVVPVPPEGFYCTNVSLEPDMQLRARVVVRQEGEDPFVEVRAEANAKPAKFVKIVCYSAEALLENGGTRSTNRPWEIVAVLASDVESEPMDGLTMARNFLEKAGGTKSVYTAQEFAEAIYYWSQRARVS